LYRIGFGIGSYSVKVVLIALNGGKLQDGSVDIIHRGSVNKIGVPLLKKTRRAKKGQKDWICLIRKTND